MSGGFMSHSNRILSYIEHRICIQCNKLFFGAVKAPEIIMCPGCIKSNRKNQMNNISSKEVIISLSELKKRSLDKKKELLKKATYHS